MNTFEGSHPRDASRAAACAARARATSMRPPVPEIGLMTTATDGSATKAPQHLRRQKPDELPRAARGQPLEGDVTDAALLERQCAPRTEQVRGKFAGPRFGAD